MKEKDLHDFDEEFRDSIATVDETGKRIWIYPRKPSGKLHAWRVLVTVFLLTLFFAAPFIKINGQPLLMTNIFEGRFVIFGQVFWPQDFILVAILLISFFVFVIVFTVVFGRIWCGWLCPQTLFMEMVFRKIEYWIEGDAPAQRRLDQSPMNFQKLVKKTVKHFIFITIALIIAHTVMAYLIGVDKVISIITQPPSHHAAGFAALVAFTGIFYGNFAKFREQACVAVCPYGRLQGVLLSKDSIVIAYDWLRGEPRGRMKKSQTNLDRGDCIDCKLCVHVCPTGIDIRNGTQLECVNCTACIDACDEVMVKIGKPTGLIRYASYNGIKKGLQKIITPRVVGYMAVLLAMVVILGFTFGNRSPVETTVLKVPGTLYQRTSEGFITNLYNVEFINKTFADVTIKVKVESPSAAILQKADGKQIKVPAEGMLKGVLFIKIPAERLTSARTIVIIGVYNDKDEQIDLVKVKFIGPVSKSSDVNSRIRDERKN